MTRTAIARRPDGTFLPGQPTNPGGRPPQRVSAALRQLAAEVEIVDGEEPKTRAERLAAVIYERAMDPERKDAILWARVFLERVEGAVRQEVEMNVGMGQLLSQAHERWLDNGKPNEDDYGDADDSVDDAQPA